MEQRSHPPGYPSLSVRNDRDRVAQVAGENRHMVGRIFLNRYQTVRLLGEGGMGKVFLARQVDLGRNVVVKVMHEHIAADPKFLRTLPARNAAHGPVPASLRRHASTMPPQRSAGPVHHHGVHQRASRSIPCCSATAGSARRRVGRLLGQLCEVLQAAHSEGIIHRDLKPANLMVVDPDTPYEKIKVMDFGLAKLAQRRTASGMQLTESNMRVRRRHAGLHLSRAGARRGIGPSRRPVQRRRHPVRNADGPAAVLRPLDDGHAPGPRHRRAAVLRWRSAPLPGRRRRSRASCGPVWKKTRHADRRAPATWRSATKRPWPIRKRLSKRNCRPTIRAP